MNQNYQAWAIIEEDFPTRGTLKEQIQFLIGYGVLAPSTHNTQPWLFNVDQNHLKIEPNLQRQLPEADPDGRNLMISLGACAFNLQVAAAHFGLTTKLAIQGSSVSDAYINLDFAKVDLPDPQLATLFPQITRRYTEKRIIKGENIDAPTIKRLQDISDGHSKVFLNNQRSTVDALSKLCYQAAASYAANPRFGKELSVWLRGNKTSKFDGMPGFASGLTNAKALTGKTVIKILPKSIRVMAKKYYKMLVTSPAVGIITTSEDNWKAWLEAGLVFEHLALTASVQGLSLSPMAALIERPERKSLKNYFGNDDYPQMFFRLIKADKHALHSPRRLPTRQLAESHIIEELNNKGLNASLQSLQVGPYRINYITAGKGQPLLLIHGANLGWGQWLSNIHELAQHFQVIAIDLPGCGGSSAINFRKARFKSDFVNPVVLFIEKLHLEHLTLVGHSFGGAVAIKVAQIQKSKIDRLVLVSPMGFTRDVPGRQKLITIYPFAKLISRTAVKPNRANMATFLQGPLVNKSVVSEGLIDYYWAATSENHHNHPLLFMNSLTKPLKLKPELFLVKNFQQISQPTLIIVGDHDPLTPIKRIEKSILKSASTRLEIFANTGHVPSLEQSDKFNRMLIGFAK